MEASSSWTTSASTVKTPSAASRWLTALRRVGRCALGRCPGGQSHVQHPLGDAWPVDAGLDMDMTPNLPPDGSIAVSDGDVDDCSTSIAVAAAPVNSAAWTSGWSLVEEPRCVAVTMAY